MKPPSLAHIKLLDSQSNKVWDDFVYGHPGGTFFHLSKFKNLLENYFNLETYYLYTHIDDKITGLLPLARVKSTLFSDALISTPFCVYGGVLANNVLDQTRLINEAKTIASNLKVDYIELRQMADNYQEGHEQSLYVHFQKKLFDNLDDNLKAIPRKQRAMVRKAIKKDLTYQVEYHVDNFYPLYSESVKALGTPVLAKSYYKRLLEYFPENTDVLTIYSGKTPISSVLNFYFKDTVLPYYGGGGALAKKLSANDFMYWSLMNHALEKNIQVFDFGRSKVDTGSYRFKKHWGFEPTPLHYRYLPIEQHHKPNINPTNPKYQLFIKMWKKLPLGVANTIGPMIARRLG